MSPRDPAVVGRPGNQRSGRIVAAALTAFTAFTAGACTGSIEGGPASGPGGPAGPTGSSPTGTSTGPGGLPGTALPPVGTHPLEPRRDSAACKQISAGPAPIRRLTRAEYDRTVADLLGEDLKLARSFPAEEVQNSFDNSAELRSVSDVLAEGYVGAAKQIGKTVLAKLPSLLPCEPARDGGEQACLHDLAQYGY